VSTLKSAECFVLPVEHRSKVAYFVYLQLKQFVGRVIQTACCCRIVVVPVLFEHTQLVRLINLRRLTKAN